MLEIDDLWVNIDDKEVLKGINLRVPVGETHILFGKNGSGKSSLLMTIMGFERYAEAGADQLPGAGYHPTAHL
jgi:Fe-S cluster assembly ATP-binding protein